MPNEKRNGFQHLQVSRKFTPDRNFEIVAEKIREISRLQDSFQSVHQDMEKLERTMKQLTQVD